MSLTGKKINAALEIMQLALKANDVQPVKVGDVLKYAGLTANLLSNTELDRRTLEQTIVDRMVTITVEAK